MRTYVDSSEIAHLWAHQKQESARCSASMSFSGMKFYSYATVIAEIAKVKGETIYCVSTEHYSGVVRRAIPRDAKVFYVPGLRVGGYEGLADPKRILRDWALEANRKITDSRVKTELQRRKAIVAAQEVIERMNELADAFHVAKKTRKDLIPKLPCTPAELADWQEMFRQAEEAKQRKLEARRRAEEEERDRERMDALGRWLNGERVNHWELPHRPHMLRVNDNGQVETSGGVRFSMADAKRGMTLVDAVVAANREWRANGERCPIGGYQIDRIDADGTVYAGCHVVKLDAINRIRPIVEAYKTPEQVAS